jgi:hypothetical protein
VEEIKTLAQQWAKAKAAEAHAVSLRRQLEDEMTQMLGIRETLDGTETHATPEFKIKIVGRIDRKVNAELAQELAAEYGLQEHLGTLFRWKPELDMRAWRAADDAVLKVFSQAVTAKPGRPSFSIDFPEGV